MHDLFFWNLNHPEYLDDGLKNIVIDISTDGTNWTTVDTFTLGRATGSSFYEGSRGPDLSGVAASHLLITALDNHGGGCFGLSEVKIYTEDYEPTEFEFTMKMCEQDGLYKNLSGGITEGGTYSGRGVSDNGDETFDFDASIAGPGMHEILYAYGNQVMQGMMEVLPCQTDICGGCLSCPSFAQETIDGSPIPEGTYHGYELMSEGTVTDNQVIFWGAQSAEMHAEFEVSSSGLFEVDIRTCYDNMVMNEGFEMGLSPWLPIFNNGAEGSATITTDAYEGESAVLLEVTVPGTNSAYGRIYYRDLTIEEGKTYRFSIVAKGDSNQVVTLRVQGESDPFTSYINREMPLKPHWQVFSYEFVAPTTRVEDIRIHLRCGLQEGKYWFDRVLLAAKE
ncbi:MAG: carbohydrate binding domain-containing protein [Saprospiraceae bacterium]|nr:carbohydrate binding domain-containing protein [Saprospiraceae bacterium]